MNCRLCGEEELIPWRKKDNLNSVISEWIQFTESVPADTGGHKEKMYNLCLVNEWWAKIFVYPLVIIFPQATGENRLSYLFFLMYPMSDFMLMCGDYITH